MNLLRLLSAVVLMCLTQIAWSQEHHEITVNGLCGMCKDRIETTAKNVIGVNTAEWNMDTKKLNVKVNPDFFEINDLHQALADVGHDTELIKASDEAYANLHSCCKYRDELPPGVEHQEEDESATIINERLATFAQNHDHGDEGDYVHGMVYEKLTTSRPEPLIGANVLWAGTEEGTSTDVDGFFELKRIDETDQLVITYIGYEPDTIDMEGQSLVGISLNVNNIIENVSITHKKKSTEISFINPMKVQNINQKELFKAACCSLSESFETNPAVDVGFTDAVTGTRRIELLGLAGPNVQITRENIPYIRGIASIYGFEYTPGSWIESMQLNTGAGSVVNGPEGMTGQINVEIKKPESSEKAFVNLYANDNGRYEANVNAAVQVTDKISTGVLLHGSTRSMELDRNSDGFYDSPLGDQIAVMNRWKFSGEEFEGQMGIKGTFIDKRSGMLPDLAERPWTAPIKTDRYEGWLKVGKVFKDAPYKSVGLQLSASSHDQEASFGDRVYNADQQSFYANALYQTIIGDVDKKVKFGVSLQYDDVEELVGNDSYMREESLTGAFVEYNQQVNEEFSLVAGLRGDYHNIYGLFFTPRLHLKYSPQEYVAFRLAAGRGQRTASIFAENIGVFATNRAIIVESDGSDNPYGLNPEVAYNVGANYTQEFTVNDRSVLIGLDYYYTHFTQQIVVDYDQNPQELYFYNLDGDSYSHSVQAQVDYEMFPGVDVRLAYRFNDVKTDYKSGLLQKPLTPRHRAFINTGIEFGAGWIWDGTLTWQGEQRIPSTASNPEQFRRPDASPDFLMMNTQLTKNFKNGPSIYLGAENLFNYRQDNPIINVDNPFNDYFDSSLIWGPVMGRNVYIGLRYAIL